MALRLICSFKDGQGKLTALDVYVNVDYLNIACLGFGSHAEPAHLVLFAYCLYHVPLAAGFEPGLLLLDSGDFNAPKIFHCIICFITLNH